MGVIRKITQFEGLGSPWIRRHGRPATAEIVSVKLTVTVPGQAGYSTEVGNAVPPEARTLTAAGTDVPAKVLPGFPNAVGDRLASRTRGVAGRGPAPAR
jgi:hypothetical protein